MPGSFKNLLDWMVGGDEFTDKPVAWIRVAADSRRGGSQSTLATVLGYVQATVFEDALPTRTDPSSSGTPDGSIADTAASAEIVGPSKPSPTPWSLAPTGLIW